MDETRKVMIDNIDQSERLVAMIEKLVESYATMCRANPGDQWSAEPIKNAIKGVCETLQKTITGA